MLSDGVSGKEQIEFDPQLICVLTHIISYVALPDNGIEFGDLVILFRGAGGVDGVGGAAATVLFTTRSRAIVARVKDHDPEIKSPCQIIGDHSHVRLFGGKHAFLAKCTDQRQGRRRRLWHYPSVAVAGLELLHILAAKHPRSVCRLGEMIAATRRCSESNSNPGNIYMSERHVTEADVVLDVVKSITSQVPRNAPGS